VEDVAKCMIALMKSDIQAERYIISAENRSYENVNTIAANIFNLPPPQKIAKPWVMELAWRGAALIGMLTRKSPAIDKVAAQTASQTRNLDNSKIKAATGIEFKPVNITIREICERLKSVE